MNSRYKIILTISLILNIALLMAVFYYRNNRSSKVRDDKECVMSWNNCIKQMNTHFDIVFFGDSHTAYGHFNTAFPDIQSINLGYMGEDPKGMLRRVEVIQAVSPHKIFLMAGLNGLSEQSMPEFESAYCTLIDSILSAVPGAELYIENILPVNDDIDLNRKIIEANKVIQKISGDRDLTYIDLYSLYAVNSELPQDITNDGVHLKTEAYSIWYASLRPYISTLTL